MMKYNTNAKITSKVTTWNVKTREGEVKKGGNVPKLWKLLGLPCPCLFDPPDEAAKMTHSTVFCFTCLTKSNNH